jgi:hypothetical protein
MAVKDFVFKQPSTIEKEKSYKGKLINLPIAFMEWQVRSRLELLQGLNIDSSAPTMRSMAAHIPVVATKNRDQSMNLEPKGIILLPKEHLLDHFTLAFRETVYKCKGNDPNSTFRQRLSCLLDLYSDTSNFDTTLMGGLELFEGTTYSNLKSDHRASLLFSGGSPNFNSYQIDGTVDFVEPGDAHYEYLLSARELFSMDRFNIYQTTYPLGYLLNVSQVIDKTPYIQKIDSVR